jgi:hypothetical protein
MAHPLAAGLMQYKSSLSRLAIPVAECQVGTCRSTYQVWSCQILEAHKASNCILVPQSSMFQGVTSPSSMWDAYRISKQLAKLKSLTSAGVPCLFIVREETLDILQDFVLFRFGQNDRFPRSRWSSDGRVPNSIVWATCISYFSCISVIISRRTRGRKSGFLRRLW